MKAIVFFWFSVLACCGACYASSNPLDGTKDSGAIVEAGTAVVTDVCKLIEGVDDNGIFRTVCATLDELIAMGEYILTLRAVNDAGTPKSTTCLSLPTSTMCMTSAERAKGALFVVELRKARFLRNDAGSK